MSYDQHNEDSRYLCPDCFGNIEPSQIRKSVNMCVSCAHARNKLTTTTSHLSSELERRLTAPKHIVDQVLLVQVKDVYGKRTIYPQCTQSHLFCELLSQRTLTARDIDIIKRMGIAVYTKKEEEQL